MPRGSPGSPELPLPPHWAHLSRESALGAAERAAPPQPEHPKFTPAMPHSAGCPALRWISRFGFKIALRSSSKTRMRELSTAQHIPVTTPTAAKAVTPQLGTSGQGHCGHFLSSLQQCCLADLGFFSVNEQVPSRIPEFPAGIVPSFAGLSRGCSMQELSQAAQGEGEATELFAVGSRVLLQQQWKFILLQETAASGAKEPLQSRKHGMDRFRWSRNLGGCEASTHQRSKCL